MDIKRNHWTAIFIVAATIFVTAGVFIYKPKIIDGVRWVAPRHQFDAVLIKNFLENRADFELLRKMATEDTGILFINNEKVIYADPAAANMTVARIRDYRTLFKRAGVKDISVSFDRNIINLTSSRRGLATHNSQKSYMYIEGPVFGDELLADLDEFSSSEIGSGLRRIDGNWYLHFEGY